MAMLVVSIPNLVFGGEVEWQLQVNKNDIQIYVSDTPDSRYQTVKAQVVVTAGLKKLITFVQDETINIDWVPFSGGAKLLDRPTPKDSIVHFVVEGSWPFQDRDAIALFSISQNSDDLTTKITMTNKPNYLPLSPDYIRMPSYSGFWSLKPLTPDTTLVIYQNHVEPGGNIPSWIANTVAVSSTFKALDNLRTHIRKYDRIAPRLNFLKQLDSTNRP
ncbi:MAG: START domain-containing protein [Pseudomonadales bacterium]|nr:START domain-containing protein [Pseudomonadales bacterium]